jgi:hypothetical protein
MLNVSGLGAQNIRSLKNLNSITFKPLTILVGKNSAGKSTFARLLPLLKQSSEKRKHSPILWWGRLVDFGSFDDVRTSFSDDDFIDLSISFDSSSSIFLIRNAYYSFKEIPLQKPAKISSTFRLSKNSEDGTTILRELIIDIFGVKINAKFNSNQVSSISLNEENIDIPNNIRLNWSQGQIFPLIRSINTSTNQQTSISDEALFVPRRHTRFGASNVRKEISYFLHGNTQEERKEEIADRLPIAPIDDFLQYCKNLPNSTTTWKGTFAATTNNSQALKKLHATVILYKIDILLAILDEVTQKFLTETSYLEPLRATAQRYYRREEISTDELDPKGLNTPFFIQGLTQKERDSLNSWTTENFGFKLSVKGSGGHLSLNIQQSGQLNSSRNMADVGLGYSQLVPVALQLWAAQHRRTAENSRKYLGNRRSFGITGRTVVVEQPELHLHPAYQAKLADVFSNSINLSRSEPDGIPLNIIAETHSPNLISRLGELVSLGKINPKNIQILVFEDSNDNNEGSTVRTAEFDDDGILKNWPIGFFDA